MFFFPFFSLCERKNVSVYYSEKNQSYTYKFGTYDSKYAIGRGIYDDDYEYRSGWKHLHIEASNIQDDDIMAYASGYAEGLLTQPLFENHYKNTIAALCHDFIPDCINNVLPANVTEFFENNYNWVVNNITNSPMETEYEWGANITLSQFNGLYDGYVEGCKLNGGTPISKIDFWTYQCRSEIYDVYRGRFPKHSVDPRLLLDRRGSFILRRSSYNQLFIGHSSWRSYAEMTRIAKRYRIDFQHISNVVARKTFSSYQL